MLKEQGVVINIDDRFAWIQTQRKSGCGHCSSNQECGTASLAQVFGHKQAIVKVVNDLTAKVGDHVVIGVEEQALIKGSLLLYLLPLFSLFIAAIGYQTLAITYTFLPSTEIFTALSGFGGLLIGLFSVNYFTKKMEDNSRYQPIILKIETTYPVNLGKCIT
jgi:sigma-E factor negative regulatory protein RseC